MMVMILALFSEILSSTSSIFTNLSWRKATSAAKKTLQANKKREKSWDQFTGLSTDLATAPMNMSRQLADRNTAETMTSSLHIRS
ncbi:hypothetical protein SDC9_192051 [bioreactor metagenome]|uniref:Uncharacterized protein n=1 Tax=bioreactor metagenome TaxID=1076179 RepID=A0A645I0W1_9ZZZZ